MKTVNQDQRETDPIETSFWESQFYSSRAGKIALGVLTAISMSFATAQAFKSLLPQITFVTAALIFSNFILICALGVAIRYIRYEKRKNAALREQFLYERAENNAFRKVLKRLTPKNIDLIISETQQIASDKFAFFQDQLSDRLDQALSEQFPD